MLIIRMRGGYGNEKEDERVYIRERRETATVASFNKPVLEHAEFKCWFLFLF